METNKRAGIFVNCKRFLLFFYDCRKLWNLSEFACFTGLLIFGPNCIFLFLSDHSGCSGLCLWHRGLQKYPNHLRESFDQYQRSLQWISSPDWTTNHKKCITQGKEVKFASSLLWRDWIAFPDQMVKVKIFKECELLPFCVKCLLHVFKYGILSI